MPYTQIFPNGVAWAPDYIQDVIVEPREVTVYTMGYIIKVMIDGPGTFEDIYGYIPHTSVLREIGTSPGELRLINQAGRDIIRVSLIGFGPLVVSYEPLPICS